MQTRRQFLRSAAIATAAIPAAPLLAGTPAAPLAKTWTPALAPHQLVLFSNPAPECWAFTAWIGGSARRHHEIPPEILGHWGASVSPSAVESSTHPAAT